MREQIKMKKKKKEFLYRKRCIGLIHVRLRGDILLISHSSV